MAEWREGVFVCLKPGAKEAPEVASAMGVRALSEPWPWYPGDFLTALQRQAKAPKRVTPGSQEQGSEEEPLPRTVGVRSPREGAGPRATQALSQTVLWSKPPHNPEGSFRTFSSNLRRRKFRGGGTLDRGGKS